MWPADHGTLSTHSCGILPPLPPPPRSCPVNTELLTQVLGSGSRAFGTPWKLALPAWLPALLGRCMGPVPVLGPNCWAAVTRGHIRDSWPLSTAWFPRATPPPPPPPSARPGWGSSCPPRPAGLGNRHRTPWGRPGPFLRSEPRVWLEWGGVQMLGSDSSVPGALPGHLGSGREGRAASLVRGFSLFPTRVCRML